MKKLALIIDDEPAICQSLSGVLEDEGWKTVSAHTGDAGLKILGKKHPALVFVDVWLGEMDGIAVLQKIKELDPSLPVVVMSGNGNICLLYTSPSPRDS